MTNTINTAAASGAADNCTILPDGSAFAVGSFPLPQDHWLYAPHEYEPGADEPKELLAPILTHAQRNEVVAAVRYAVRGATMCGKDPDFDPDALVQNAVYALCGPFGRTALVAPAQPAPQQEAQEPVAWKHDCAALLTNDVELWIATCPHCGKPHSPQHSPAAQGDALSDAVRVPLDSLHADAAYLIGRLREGSMPYARVIEIIRERIDAAKAAIHARAAQGDALGVVLDVVLDAFENKTRGIPQAHIAAALVAELRAAIEAASTTPAPNPINED